MAPAENDYRSRRRCPTLQLLYATVFGEIAAEAGHCMIECDPVFGELFAAAFPRATICPLDAFGRGSREALAKADYQVSGAAMMNWLRSEHARFLRRPLGFSPRPETLAKFHRRLAALPPGPRVGVASGAGAHLIGAEVSDAVRDRRAMWQAICAGTPEAQFIEMRLAASADDRYRPIATDLARRAFSGRIAMPEDVAIDNYHLFDDATAPATLEALAALLASVDLLIAEDGPVWALAGLVGTPTWLICPFVPLGPQWLADAQGRSLWRPSVRLLHPQRLGDLGSIVGRVLEKISSQHSGAVDLSQMGQPAGPHWRTASLAVRTER